MGVSNDMFRHFALWTSASGLPHIARAHNKCLCVFWIMVFLVCAAMFAFQMVLLIQNYLAYDVQVQTQLLFQELEFPAVTICNLNPYKQSAVMKNPDVSKLLQAYETAISNQNAGGDEFGLTNTTNDTMAIQANARAQLMYMAAGMTNDTKLSLGYSRDEFIWSCTFNGNPCKRDRDLQTYIDPTYGVCYQFNNHDTSSYSSSRAGPNYGLKFLLNTNLSEYLDITESAGVRVTVNSNGERVFPDAFGYNAAAGFTTSFSLQFVTTSRLGGSYGDCDKRTSIEYSVEGCFRACLQDYIVKTCGCGDPRFPIKSGQTYCSGSKITCVNSAGGVGSSSGSSSGSSGGFDATKMCNCPQLCEESTYTMTVSSAVWPSQRYIPENCRGNKEIFGQFGYDRKNCTDWYGDNTMMVELYYQQMNFESLKEQAAYPFVSLLSDFGGQIGLWIGVSVITMIEFLIVPIMMCMACCRAKKKQTIFDIDHAHIDDLDEEEEDNMFNKLGSKAEQGGNPAAPPPPYPGAEDGKPPMTPGGPPHPSTPGPNYSEVEDFDQTPPVPHQPL